MTVYEKFKSDGKMFPRFTDEDKFECEVWAINHKYGTQALLKGLSVLVIEEEKTD